MKNRHPFFAAVYLILRKEELILMADRINTGYEDGKWSLVAGHIEANESALQALEREALEEAGIHVSQKDMSVVHIMHRKGDDQERFDIFIEAHAWEGEPYIAEPDKSSRMEWFPIDTLPELTIDYVREAIICIQQKRVYSEYGWT